jgi:hypothetical protein
LEHHRTFIYAPVVVIRAFWGRLGLDDFFRRQTASRKLEFEVSRSVWLMVLSRLIRPTSKLSLTEWHQELWQPECLVEGYPQYQHYLRSLDVLSKCKGTFPGRIIKTDDRAVGENSIRSRHGIPEIGSGGRSVSQGQGEKVFRYHSGCQAEL